MGIITVEDMGEGQSSGYNYPMIAMVAALGCLAVDSLFGNWNWCPNCGGSGEGGILEIVSKSFLIRMPLETCPLKTLRPDWHDGAAA